MANILEHVDYGPGQRHPGLVRPRAHEKAIVPLGGDNMTGGFPVGYARPMNANTHISIGGGSFGTDGIDTVNYATLAGTKTLNASDNGKTFFLSHATEFATTLPAVGTSAGFRFTFIVANAPETASYTIVAAAGTPILGHVVSSQDAGGNSDSETSGCLTITFVDSKAVVGDRVDLECDGTNWFARCTCKTFDAITLS